VKLNLSKVRELVKRALEEDIRSGDATTRALIPAKSRAKAKLISKGFGTVAGMDVAMICFEVMDRKIKFRVKVKDGGRAYPGRVLAAISGPSAAMLSAERTALNFLQRMSGIATTTRAFAKKVRFRKTRILATRKTAPGLRELDKYSVEVGGGSAHRMGLHDAVLIKENHVASVGSVRKAVSLARRNAPPTMSIEVEASSLKEVGEAISAGANTILLDNMNLLSMRRAVQMVKKHNEKLGVPQASILTEASGGINLKNVARVARTGVDSISIGALTHSPKALDMSLKFS